MLTKHLGLVEYEKTLNEMKNFTHNRSIETRDEIWILEHFPVYTIGSSYSDHAESDLWPGVPLVKSDRGGKLTYHGPGQLIIYVLLSLKKYQLTIRKFVRLLEVSVINLL